MRLTAEQRAQVLAELSRRAAPPAPPGAARARRRPAKPAKPAKPVARGALDALRRVERELARATAETTATTILAVVRELRDVDALSVEVGRAGTVERLTALGVPDAEAAVDAAFTHYGLTPNVREVA